MSCSLEQLLMICIRLANRSTEKPSTADIISKPIPTIPPSADGDVDADGEAETDVDGEI